MSDDDFIIHELVRIRKERRIDRRELARTMGISENTLASWESLQNDPRRKQLQEWGRALSYELDWHLIGRNLRAAE